MSQMGPGSNSSADEKAKGSWWSSLFGRRSALPDRAWGIDLGHSALKAVQLIRSGAELRIHDVEIIEHERAIVQSGAEREAMIRSCLIQFAQRHPSEGEPVAIGISGHEAQSASAKLPPIAPEKIADVIRFQAGRQFSVPIDQLEWTYQLFQPPESLGSEVFNLRPAQSAGCTGGAILRYSCRQRANGADESPGRVQRDDPRSAGQGRDADPRSGHGWNGPDHRRSVEYLAGLGPPSAETSSPRRWRRVLRSASPRPRNSNDAPPRAAALGRSLRPSLRCWRSWPRESAKPLASYSAVRRQVHLNGAIALGGTAALPGLVKYLQQNLQLELRTPETLGVKFPADGNGGAAMNDHALRLASAFGLALQAMGEAKIACSFPLPTGT